MLSTKSGEESQAFLAIIKESEVVGQMCGRRARDVEVSELQDPAI